MNTFAKLLRSSLAAEPMDVWLSRWGCNIGGSVLLALTSLYLARHTAGAALWLGFALAVVAFLATLLLGKLAARVHCLALAGQAPHRKRRGEYASYGVCAGILLAGWLIYERLPGQEHWLVVGLVAVHALCMLTICAGCWSTIANCRSASNQ